MIDGTATRTRVRLLAGCTLATLALVPAAARAAEPGPATAQAAAEALFVEGKRLVAAGDYAQACAKFAASEELAPAPGTLLNLADCYEKNGRLASAWVTFREATAASERMGRSAWAHQAAARAQLLEPRLPTLAIEVDAAHGPAGLEVARDGVLVPAAIWGSPVPVDPSTVRVEARAPNRKPWTTEIRVDAEHPHVVVQVPPLDELPAPAPSPDPAVPAKGTGARSLAGPLTLAAVGGAGLIAGTYFGVRAIDFKNKREEACPGGQCTPLAPGYYSDAQTSGTASTIAFVTAGVSLAAGAAWWWLGRDRPSPRAAYVLPLVATGAREPGMTGLAIGGAL